MVDVSKKRSEETRRRIAEAIRRRWQDESYRQKVSAAQKGKRLSVEQCKKMSEAMRKRWEDADFRRRQIEAHKGKRLSDEARKKLSNAFRGDNNPMKRPEVRAKLQGEHNPAKRLEVREKLRGENNPAKRPEVREKISLAKKGRGLSEEHRRKLSIAHQLSRAHCGDNNPAKRPEVREKIRNTKRREENRKVASEKMKCYISSLSPEERAARIEPAINTKAGTSIERAVWEILDALGIEYETQKRIGPYFVDIYVPSKNLVIECDGEWWHSQPEAIQRDKAKDEYLKKRDYHVLRLPERVIRGGEASQVLEDILFGGVLDG